MLDTTAVVLTILICISLFVDIITGYLMSSYIKSKPLGQQTFNDFVLNHFLNYGNYLSASQAFFIILGTFEPTSQDFWIHFAVFAHKFGTFSVHVSHCWIQIVRYLYLMHPGIIYDHDEQLLMYIIRIVTVFISILAITFEYCISPPIYVSMDSLTYLRNYGILSKEYIVLNIVFGLITTSAAYVVKKKLATIDYKIHLKQEMDAQVSNKFELFVALAFFLFIVIIALIFNFYVSYSWNLFLACMLIAYVFCFNLAKVGFILKNRSIYVPFLNTLF